jgi:hypothetical protein
MPIQKIQLNHIKGFRYGRTGKKYYGEGAREKAKKQGQAIEISKLRREGYKIPIKGDNRKRGTIRRL